MKSYEINPAHSVKANEVEETFKVPGSKGLKRKWALGFKKNFIKGLQEVFVHLQGAEEEGFPLKLTATLPFPHYISLNSSRVAYDSRPPSKQTLARVVESNS